MVRLVWLAIVAVGCGDDLPVDRGFLDIVGHHDLGARGMNSAIAIADDVVYVGSRIDNARIAIIDVADPAQPIAVGEIPGLVGMSSRELRAVADRDTLVVLSMRCDPELHGCAAAGAEPEAIKLYDIADRRAPVLAGTYRIAGTSFNRPRSPHEMYLRRDGDHVVLYVAAPPSAPSLEVIDITDIHQPVRVAGWDPSEQGLHSAGGDDILHSVSASLDGTRLFLSHQLGGLFVADVAALPTIALITPPEAGLDFAPPASVGPHSAVEVPGRDLLIVTEEVYPVPYGTGCPWGTLRTVDVSDPAAPRVVGEFGLPENDPAICAQSAFERVAFTAHNVTATHDLAFATWYAGGLQVIDLADPAKPRQLVELRPEPLAAVAVEDPALGGNAVEMWSYPIIKDGLIYVVDARNGLYVLRYGGLHSDQVLGEDFLEGNSNL